MRHPDWRQRLADHLAAHARAAYRPGETDCILFAGGARRAVRGEDLTGPYASRYATIEEGFALAREAGFDSPFDAIVSGLDEVPVAFAQVGDLACLEDAGGQPAMGVVIGETIACLTPRGIGHVALTAARRVWRQ